MFVADNKLWQEWLHGRVVTNEHHMRQTTSFGRFFRYQHRQVVSLQRHHTFLVIMVEHNARFVQIQAQRILL